MQELVGREQMRSATALNGVAMNLARAVGPAIAGLLVAQIGVAAVFALNALSYLALGAILLTMRPPVAKEHLLPERFVGAVIAGTRYVRHSPSVRRLLLRTLIFVVPGAALWALLPLVANTLLGLDALGYGVLLGALGVGAVSGAAVLPRIVARLSPSRLVLAAGLVFGAATAVSALVPNAVVVVVVLVPAGLAWLCMLATMNGNLSMFLPGWVRARGLSVYQMVFAGGQALAAIAWGLSAQWLGLVPTLLAAAVLLGIGSATVARWPLRDVSGLDRDPAIFWPEPQLEVDPEPEDGPVLVTVTYTVPDENVASFLTAMLAVRRMKMRTGATSFSLYQDGAAPDRYVEVAQYPNWAEHLRQHAGRLTGSDRDLELGRAEMGRWRTGGGAAPAAGAAARTRPPDDRSVTALRCAKTESAPRTKGPGLMSVDRGLLALLEAKPGKGAELAAFLQQGRELAVAEAGTVTWYAFKISDTTYGIFDTFETEDGRQAHLTGQIPAALGQVGPDLLATDPDIKLVDVIAVK